MARETSVCSPCQAGNACRSGNNCPAKLSQPDKNIFVFNILSCRGTWPGYCKLRFQQLIQDRPEVRAVKRNYPTPYVEFDSEVYFAIVADNLIANFGQGALPLADMALVKMHNMGDDEGYGLWSGVHAQLCRRIRDMELPSGTTLH